jgi:hypothetical protein
MDAMAASCEGEAKAPPPTAGNAATDKAIRTAKKVRMMFMARFAKRRRTILPDSSARQVTYPRAIRPANQSQARGEISNGDMIRHGGLSY